MAKIQQANRPSKVETPLGEDKLVMVSFSGHEEMSRLFTYHCEMTSEDDSIAPEKIVGKKITFGTELADGTVRNFNGFVNAFTTGDRSSGDRSYRATVVPWLWFLTRTADVRIFQNKNVPSIIEKIFGDLGYTDFDLSGLRGNHPKRDYCVQYRETDFNFVSRLMEEEGIFYFFKHEAGKHTMVLGDHKGVFKPLPEKEVEYEVSYGSRTDMTATVTAWEHKYEFVTGRYAQQDYNFETPKTSLMTNASTVVNLPDAAKFEVYDYPGLYLHKDEGNAETKVHMEEDEVPFDISSGAGTCKSFAVGGKFTFKKHDCQAEEGKTYVITGIQHTFSSSAGESYQNSFTCIPDSVNFRPSRITPKPFVQGPQTAVVVGPKGEEIYTDKYGRIKVQFHWDREGKKDENSSCWMRCMQGSAGRGWGTMFIPRIGQEVVITFLEGDPDRPLVTGVVYNADQMPAYELPKEKTKSYIKTNSSKDGDGYNELRFEDLAGKEQIFIHAQKNFDMRVLNNRHEHVEGSMQLKIGHLKSGKPDDSGKLDIVIEKRKRELIGEDGKELHVKGPHKELIDGKASLTVGGDFHTKVDKLYALEASDEVHIKAGMKLILEAGTQISLKVGGNFIDIGPAGVSITGTMVNINSGGAAGSGSGSKPEEPKDAEAEADDSKTGRKSCS